MKFKKTQDSELRTFGLLVYGLLLRLDLNCGGHPLSPDVQDFQAEDKHQKSNSQSLTKSNEVSGITKMAE